MIPEGDSVKQLPNISPTLEQLIVMLSVDLVSLAYRMAI